MYRPLLCLSLALTCTLSGALDAAAATIDLAHPTAAGFVSSSLADNAVTTRGVVVDAQEDVAISSIGLRFDPLHGGATMLAVDIYASSLAADFSNPGAGHGALLASASTAIVDTGLSFYDVPIALVFSASTRYDIAFRALSPDGWGMGTNDMELYFYHFAEPDGPYTVGPLAVVDGFSMGGGSFGYANITMPHVRLEGAAAVPEPAAGLMVATVVLAAMALRRRER